MTDKQKRNQRAFKNMTQFFTNLNFTILCTSDDFYDSNNVVYKCINNHIITLNRQSFNNKRDLYYKTPNQFCSHCKRYDELKINKQSRIKQIEQLISKFNHKLLSLEDDLKQMELKCGNCGSIGKTNFGTISRDSYTGYCLKSHLINK